MSLITFSVIDQTCESVDRSFFPPRIAISTKSTTQIATVRGFPEYILSTPPKRYKSLTWQGTSEQQLFVPAFTTPAYYYCLVDYYGPNNQFTGPSADSRGFSSLTSGVLEVAGTGATPDDWLLNGIWVGPNAGPVDAPIGPAGVYHNLGNAPYFLIPPNSFPDTVTVTGPFLQPAVNHPAVQIAGARYDYSGSSAIDEQGNYTSLYLKNLSSMCSATGNQVTTFIPITLQPYVFTGWIGPTGHTKCTPPGIPYNFVSNQAIGKGDLAIDDTSRFWGSTPVGGGTGAKVSTFVVNSPTGGTSTDVGTDQLIALFEPLPPGSSLPPEGYFLANVVFNHNYSSVLSNEYTDAEALMNAQVIVSNGSTSQNAPRTTGLVSTFTNVVFTLTCTNLIAGQAYTVSVDFLDTPSATVTTKTYLVTADTTLQKVITDIIPTPAAGHSIQVRNPQIQFA